jgi:hypothetical protein
MSWWKRALSEDSVKAKLETLWSGAPGNRARADLLFRYIDGLPPAQELIKKYLESDTYLTSWADMYINYVQQGEIGMPGWLERIVVDVIPKINPHAQDDAIYSLSRRIGIEKLDPALAAHLQYKGKLDPRWFRGREDMGGPVHEIMPNVHRVLIGALDRDFNPEIGTVGSGHGAASLLARDFAAGTASPEMKEVLGKLVARTGRPPWWATFWVEDNLMGYRSDLPPEAMGEWHRGILSTLWSRSYISEATIQWFVQHMMGEDDERLWSRVMQIILSPAIEIRTSQRLGDMMGPAIVAARKRGAISSRIDDHVVRIMVDYLQSNFSSGTGKSSPEPWVVQYLDIDGMMEKIIEGSQRIPDGSRFPTQYMYEKISQLQRAHRGGSEARK